MERERDENGQIISPIVAVPQPAYTTTTNLSFALFPPYSDELLQFHKTGKFIYVHTITSLALRL